jgi:hypothetical protein
MENMLGFLLILGLVLGIVGTALAECAADHSHTAQPTTKKPLLQT